MTRRRKNSFVFGNNQLFLLAMLLIVLNAFTLSFSSRDFLSDTVTGNAGHEGTTSICIGPPVSMTSLDPTSYQVISGVYELNVTSNNTAEVNFYYRYFGILEQLFHTDVNDGDNTYLAEFNSSDYPDGNCNYRFSAYAQSVCSGEEREQSVVFTVNNFDVSPTWNDFKNNLSTNFSALSSWTYVNNAKIGVDGAGLIEFDATNFDDMDLDRYYDISHNNITVETHPLDTPCFYGTEYIITFYNVTGYIEPHVLVNGVYCTDCIITSYNSTSGTLIFTKQISVESNFTTTEGASLMINTTLIGNATYDNSPSFNISTYLEGSSTMVPYNATCYYMTDYNPSSWTLMDETGEIDHFSQMPEQSWSYVPTNLGRYAYIQHHDYYSGQHTLYINCSAIGKTSVSSVPFYIKYTRRDRVFYEDGDEVNLYLELEESGLNVSADFSELDSEFDPSNVSVVNTGFAYNISYNISSANSVADGQYNITIEAKNDSGYETMNGSIFAHLINSWEIADIDNAFDCWNYKQGYYFDEVACDWESDLNLAADRVDVFTVEFSCFDGIDNDLDGKTDENDTDCSGVYYSIRRYSGIDSAFLADPCTNNLCRVCVGDNDANADGICDTSAGVNVQYLDDVRPGYPLRVRFIKSSISGDSVRVSVNQLDSSFSINSGTSYIRQLPAKELGGCSGGTDCISVTATTYDPPASDSFTGNLDEKLTIVLGAGSSLGSYPTVAAGKSISGSAAYQDLIFFSVSNSAIINESDNPAYCFDGEDNDLSDYYDCYDASCNLTYHPTNSSMRCEYPNEITCDDGFDNDMDGYVDCEDNDCFGQNGTTGPCYSVEDFNSTSCADNLNNDFDWGYRCNSGLAISFEDYDNGTYSSMIELTDCLDIDCDGNTGNVSLGASCEFCTELTCNDNFDNDADYYYDCVGNANKSLYERDCDRWNAGAVCPTTETICYDELDNDLDSDSINGTLSWLSSPVYGGWDCQDMDCDGEIGNITSGALCSWGDEVLCEDQFDNDGDGLIDCYDPDTCANTSGAYMNLTGQCRPCASIENVTVESCRDGDDNDYDGLVDCDDPDCSGKPGPGEYICGASESICYDFIDNDNDGDIDYDDSDCVASTTDELGPGQCDDGLDNDNDTYTDCYDSDCENTTICLAGSYEDVCYSVGYVGAIEVGRSPVVRPGENFTVCYSRNTLSVNSVVLKAGNVDDSLRILSPILNSTTSFMNGTTTDFVLVNDTYGLKAQNTDGHSGNLNLTLTSTIGTGVSVGSYDLFVSTSIPGVYSSDTISTYVAENESPVVTNISVYQHPYLVPPTDTNVTFTVLANDSGTYDSGIAFCTFNISGSVFNDSDCVHTQVFSAGTYNVSVIAYDGVLNPSNYYSKLVTVVANLDPYQSGDFYNPYPANNYPNRSFFNMTENLNIGVNFVGSGGFSNNPTGCQVNFSNGTHVLATSSVPLTNVAGEGHCNGQVSLMSVASSFPGRAGVVYFTVSVTDDSSNTGTSETGNFSLCFNYFDNSTNKTRCQDICQVLTANQLPVFSGPIPNQSWPRATTLTSIDLDEYFTDPDGDVLTFNWTIDTTRINVSIDQAHFITFDPDDDYFGIAHITFHASDLYGTVDSNSVELDVQYRQIVTYTLPPSAGGGGGGGGDTQQEEICEPDWKCTDWSPCTPAGYQSRVCVDRAECDTQRNMPPLVQECEYLPTCRDKLRNQGETGVDCGGPCPPCATCEDGLLNQFELKVLQIMSSDINDLSDCGGPFCPACPTCEDNIWNQGETSVDCGGPCPSCATCDDGILNQGEINIDCGGPCAPCNVRVIATAFNWNVLIMAASLMVLTAIAFVALLFGVFKKKFIRLKSRLLNYHMRLIRMFEKKKFTEKEVPIMRWANAHLDTIEESIPNKSTEQLINATDRLVRIFFKRVFLIRYAFTHDELTKELDKHKIPAVLKKAADLLFEELAQVNYGGVSVTKDDIKTLVRQVRVITERIVNEIENRKKTRINISDRDIHKISETLSGASKMNLNSTFGKDDK